MKNNWRKINIGSILSLKYGKSLPERKRTPGDYPVYGSSGVTGSHNNFFVKGPGIIVGRKGTIGSVMYEEKGFFPIDTTFYVELGSPADTDIKFIYYWLKTANLNELNSDAAVPGLNRSIAHSQKLFIPNFTEQKRIADILSAYDDLIEVNAKKIRILEEVAQAIYKEWFVDFKFPGYEKIKMVDSPQGKIPEGWNNVKISDYVDLKKGIEPGSKAYFEESDSTRVPFLRVGDLGSRKAEVYVNKEIIDNHLLNKEDIVVSLDGSPGLVIFGLYGGYSSGIRKADIEQNAPFGKAFIYCYLKSRYAQHLINAHATGTTILHASSVIKYLDFTNGPKQLFKKFEEYAWPMIEEIIALQNINENLRKTRDLLLPKLMSGEIET